MDGKTKEIAVIIESLKNSHYYNYDTDFVTFLFSTGCLTAKAVGLCWKYVADDCNSIWIGES